MSALSLASVLALALEGAARGDTEAQATAQLTRSPELLEGFDPEYPEEARAAGVEGEVHLRLTLDADGLVQRVDVVERVSPPLDWAALGAATGFVFSPAEIDGKPAAVQIDYRVRFAQPGPDEGERADGERPTSRPAGDLEEVGTATLRGRVRIAGTVRPLVGAEVAVVFDDGPRDGETAAVTSTDEAGSFRVGALSPGYYVVEISAGGYQPAKVTEPLAAGEEVDLLFHLTADLGEPFETTIRARRDKSAVSRVSLSRDEVRAIPGTFGDALRVVESLPGVARAPFLGGALILRGGAPGDSAVFFDGVEIPVLYHWGGLASVVNTSFIEELSFYPGAFGVEYGGATAGVVDVRSHDLDLDAFQGNVDIDALDTGFFFGGPVEVGELPKVSFAFAARRSYLEGMASAALLLSSLVGVAPQALPVPSYEDFQLKVQSRPLPGHHLSLFVFGAEDRFNVLGDAPGVGGFDLGETLNRLLANHFVRASGEWQAQLLPGVTHLVRPYVGTTRRGLLSDSVVVDVFTGDALSPPTERLDWGVRDELRVRMFPWLRLRAGVEHVGSTVGVSLGEPFALPPEECPPDMKANGLCAVAYDVTGLQLSVAGYAQVELGPIGGLTVFPGLRVEHISTPYEDHLGSVLGDKGAEALASGTTVDPRVSLRWEPFPSFALKGAVGQYRTAPRAEEWLLDDDGELLDLPRALHAVAGLEYHFTDRLELDLQVYGVRRDRLVQNAARAFDPSTSGLPGLISQPTSFNSRGRGQTLGLEVLLRHRPSRYFFGWIAYTFQRTFVDVGERRDPYSPAPFDQTHNLILVGRVNLPWAVTLGGRWHVVTGNPSPTPAAVAVLHFLEHTSYQPVLSALDRPRLPTYHRLDLRLDRKWTFEGFSLTGYAEVVNVYNQFNAEVVIPGGDFRSRGTIVLLPSVPFLPTVGLSGSF